MKVNLSSEELELIELLRAGEPFSLTVQQNEIGGEWMAATSSPPLTDTPRMRLGTGMTFAEAWRARRMPPTVA